MVATPVKTKRLTVQVADLTADTTAIRSLDWDRDRFDIEFGLQNGTTYNSYLIRGKKSPLWIPLTKNSVNYILIVSTD